ncbi:MAG: phosphoribosylformimino-5-aminoimidazole carboxamide ribotide isomerase [Lachnospiraceae bacterium]|nr:phosphoribosylformimino-5-aminoimidazole carboxamide ribotide isomerase [Lachnospiraceae bacterium]
MDFRPCIDIHNGKVKQIVGGSLQDKGDRATENFVAKQDAAFFAALYKSKGIRGGHIILLNAADSEYYEATRKQALEALRAYPLGLQIGGGISPENAPAFLEAGASHCIVTSYVFYDGKLDMNRLQKLVDAVPAKRLVLDLSCKKKQDGYYIVTDRWQKDTSVKLEEKVLTELSDYCDEFLIHAVDVEGKANGIEADLAEMLGMWGKKTITYAGGVHNFEDLEQLKQLGNNRINVTIGSALDLFGGNMPFEKVLQICGEK